MVVKGVAPDVELALAVELSYVVLLPYVVPFVAVLPSVVVIPFALPSPPPSSSSKLNAISFGPPGNDGALSPPSLAGLPVSSTHSRSYASTIAPCTLRKCCESLEP